MSRAMAAALTGPGAWRRVGLASGLAAMAFIASPAPGRPPALAHARFGQIAQQLAPDRFLYARYGRVRCTARMRLVPVSQLKGWWWGYDPDFITRQTVWQLAYLDIRDGSTQASVSATVFAGMVDLDSMSLGPIHRGLRLHIDGADTSVAYTCDIVLRRDRHGLYVASRTTRAGGDSSYAERLTITEGADVW